MWEIVLSLLYRGRSASAAAAAAVGRARAFRDKNKPSSQAGELEVRMGVGG